MLDEAGSIILAA